MKKSVITHSQNETIQLGKDLGFSLTKGCVIALEGDLGSGKTHFTKGLALGLGITDTINSPTFTLLKEYEGRLNLKHIDAYRLEHGDADSLGLYDLIDDHNVVVIEWINFLTESEIPIDIQIHFEYIDEKRRNVEIEMNENFSN